MLLDSLFYILLQHKVLTLAIYILLQHKVLTLTIYILLQHKVVQLVITSVMIKHGVALLATHALDQDHAGLQGKLINQMKNKIDHTVRTFQNPIEKS